MVVALVGPTASGKSSVAHEVACRASESGRAVGTIPEVELLSVDSMAVYRGMDIGTAKPTPQQQIEASYHLIDLADPSEEFTVTRFQRAAREALSGIAARGHGALLVGGTGLYLRSVIDDLHFPGRYPEVAARLWAELDAAGPPASDERRGACLGLHGRLAELDPVAAGRMESANERRVVRALEVTMGAGQPFSSFGPGLERYPPTPVHLVGMAPDPDESRDRIAERFSAMMAGGLLDEVQTLATRPQGLARTARQALGYRELLAYVEHGVPLDEAVDEAVRRTRVFARRQAAWFRRDPRIRWVEPGEDPVAVVLSMMGAEVAEPVRD